MCRKTVEISIVREYNVTAAVVVILLGIWRISHRLRGFAELILIFFRFRVEQRMTCWFYNDETLSGSNDSIFHSRSIFSDRKVNLFYRFGWNILGPTDLYTAERHFWIAATRWILTSKIIWFDVHRERILLFYKLFYLLYFIGLASATRLLEMFTRVNYAINVL